MKVGNNIKEIREIEKNFKRSYIAEKLGISTRAYGNIENDIAEITLNRLGEIAEILECSPLYILNYKQSKKDFYNYFHNNAGNNGVNIMNQSIGLKESEISIDFYKQLLESERKRIALLEALLKNNNIEF